MEKGRTSEKKFLNLPRPLFRPTVVHLTAPSLYKHEKKVSVPCSFWRVWWWKRSLSWIPPPHPAHWSRRSRPSRQFPWERWERSPGCRPPAADISALFPAGSCKQNFQPFNSREILRTKGLDCMGAEQNSMFVDNFAHCPSSYHNSYGYFTVSVYIRHSLWFFLRLLLKMCLYTMPIICQILWKNLKS